MKPLGTITKYYPFIDEETKSTLDSLMEESSSYYDFVQRLCNEVLENEVPVNLAYLAAVQAWWCRTEETMKLIQEKFKDVPCIRPWGYVHGEAESDQVRYHDDVVESIEKALDTSLEDWIEIELHLLHTFFHYPLHTDIPSLVQPLEKAKSLADANPLLKCFEPLFCVFEGWIKRQEGDPKDALVVYQRGQELATFYDDSLYKYRNLDSQAGTLKIFNIQESIARYEDLYDLVQDLEVPYLEGEVLNGSALAFETAGEYDLAISSNIEGIKLPGKSGTVTTYLILSRIYAILGEGQQALEWANRGFEDAGHIEFPTLYLRKAWALALLNRLDDAERNLDTAYSLLIKSGSEYPLEHYYQISGVVERVRGDFLAARDFLEKAQEISERMQYVVFQNAELLELARVELLLADQSTDSSKGVAPGKWLSKLEKYATERDLPGIRMYAALFKSEFYQNHGQLKDAHATLLDALNITDSLGVKTLRKKIMTRIRELNQLLRDAEISTEKRKGS